MKSVKSDPITKRLKGMLLKRTNHNKTQSNVARPVLGARFYIPFTSDFDASDWLTWDKTCQQMASAIREYLDFVEEHAAEVRWEHWTSSTMQKTSRKGLERILTNKPRIVEWDGIELPPDDLDRNHNLIGEYGVSATFSSSRHTLGTWPKRVAHLRLDFPVTVDLNHAAALFERIAKSLPLQFAHMGYMFKEEVARWRGQLQIASKVRQLPGIAPGNRDVPDWMLGHTYFAQWLNAVSDGLMQSLIECSGEPSFRETQIERTGNIWLLRTSDRPLAGNLLKGKRDLGGIPELSAFFRPLRTPSCKWLFDICSL